MKKRFRFTLEVVLRERKRQEELRLREWVLAQRIVSRMQEELAAFGAAMSAAIERITEMNGGGVSHVGFVQAANQFIDGTKLRMEWKRQDIARAEKLMEKTRQIYVKARQKREALDRLKARKQAEHSELLRKQELRELDDLYVMRDRFRGEYWVENENGN